VDLEVQQEDLPSTTTEPNPTTGPVPSAIGDPHMGNMDGEKFDINQPGTHMFLRVPQDRGQPALLEMQAMIQRTELINPCAMYIMEVSLAGHWMGNASSLRIRASQQHPEIKVSAKGDWLPYAEFSKVPMVLSEILEGMGGKASVSADAWNKGPGWNEGFTLNIGKAEITITHSSPDEKDFLNLWVKHVAAIPFKIGGLLGMGERDPEVEKLTEICEVQQRRISGATDDAGCVSIASVMLE
jgi:hypothetical protein